MSSIKKAVLSGFKFHIVGNPDFIFKVTKHGDDDLIVYSNGRVIGHVTLTYKNMVITDLDSGLDFTAQIRLKDINFLDPK